MKTRLLGALVSLSLVLPLKVYGGAHTGDGAHAGHSGDHGHSMTPEQMAELRAKIPLYDMYTDEQIMYGMSRMKNLWGWMDDAGAKQGRVGVLGLAHGFKEPGNSQFRASYGGVSSQYPTTYGLGMAMMTSEHIQSAVTALEEAGAETIVVLPTTTADNSTLTRQWEYIFGRTEVSAYLDVPRVQTNARVIWTETPTAHPVVGEIMLDYAREKSTDPASEVVLIVGHGPQSEEDNLKELEILARHAEFIRNEGGFADVIYGNVQDDAPPQVREANVAHLRAQIDAAIDAGNRVITVTTSLTQSGIMKRLNEDFGDVTAFNDKGLVQHPRFGEWVSGTLQAALE